MRSLVYTSMLVAQPVRSVPLPHTARWLSSWLVMSWLSSKLRGRADRQGSVITHIYADTSVPEGPRVHLQRLSASLNRWKLSLPAAINYDATSSAPVPPPHVVSLQ